MIHQSGAMTALLREVESGDTPFLFYVYFADLNTTLRSATRTHSVAVQEQWTRLLRSVEILRLASQGPLSTYYEPCTVFL